MIKSHGVILYPALLLEKQVNAAAKAFFQHQAWKKDSYLGSAKLATRIHAKATQKLDYCNALYMGLPLM